MTLYTSTYTSAYEVPSFVVQVTKKLSDTPVFNGSGVLGPVRVISLEKRDDAWIVEFFNRTARELKIDSHEICDFGWIGSPLFNHDYNVVSPGIYLKGKKFTINPDEMKKAYCNLFQRVRLGWTQPSQNIDPFYVKDPNTFVLFTKEDPLPKEDCLIRYLIARFGLQNEAQCETLLMSSPYHRQYIWVRKDALSKVQEILGLQLIKSDYIPCFWHVENALVPI